MKIIKESLYDDMITGRRADIIYKNDLERLFIWKIGNLIIKPLKVIEEHRYGRLWIHIIMDNDYEITYDEMRHEISIFKSGSNISVTYKESKRDAMFNIISAYKQYLMKQYKVKSSDISVPKIKG